MIRGRLNPGFLFQIVILCCLALQAGLARADILLGRNAASLGIENDQRGWLCSIDSTETGSNVGTVDILLQEVNLDTGVVGSPVVLDSYSWELVPTTSCSVLWAPEAARVVVAYDKQIKPSGIFMKRVKTAHFDPSDQSFELISNIWEIYPGSVSVPIDVQLVRLDGHYFLSWSNIDNNPWPFIEYYEDYDALRANERNNLHSPEIDDRVGPASVGLNVDEQAGEVTLGLAHATCVTNTTGAGHKTFTWNADGTLVAQTDSHQLSAGTAGLQGCLGQRAFGPVYYNEATDTHTFVSLMHPFSSTAGYRLVLVDDFNNDAHFLHNVSPGQYYGVTLTGVREVPEASGFPATVDVVLSDDDQWIIASRDFQTNRLALHRFPAAFADLGDIAYLEPGTQLPLPEFCGEPVTATEDAPAEHDKQNNFVSLEKGPVEGELTVAYFTCPGGDPADAEWVVDRFPVDFPILVDDPGYSTAEETVLNEPAPGVLGNDTGLAGASLDVFQQPANGMVLLSADGSFQYTPDALFCGEEEFTYRVTQDSREYLARATINVTCAAAASVKQANGAETWDALVYADPAATIQDNEPEIGPVNRGQLRSPANKGAAGLQADASPSGELLQGVEVDPVATQVLLKVGDTPPGAGGAAVVGLDPPVINGNGKVAIQGQLDSGAHFIWFDGAVVFVDSSVGSPSLFEGEVRMGVGAAGEFVYSPFADGQDALWTNDGLLAAAGGALPGLPMADESVFFSRPTMDDSGQVYWIAGVDSGGNGTTDQRFLFTSPDRTLGSASAIFGSGSLIDGETVEGTEELFKRGWGVGFLYDISNSGAHHIHLLEMLGDFSNDQYVYVDGTLVLREAQAAIGAPGNYRLFSGLAINNLGHYLVAGDLGPGIVSLDLTPFVTYGSSTSSHNVMIREGEALDGLTLAEPSGIIGVGLSNADCAAQLWTVADEQHLFRGNAFALASDSLRVVSAGDELDFNGDEAADATLVRFESLFGTPIQVDADDAIIILAAVDEGAGSIEAVLKLPNNSDACDVGIFEDGFESP